MSTLLTKEELEHFRQLEYGYDIRADVQFILGHVYENKLIMDVVKNQEEFLSRFKIQYQTQDSKDRERHFIDLYYENKLLTSTSVKKDFEKLFDNVEEFLTFYWLNIKSSLIREFEHFFEMLLKRK